MGEKVNYDINFFKPHTAFLKDNVRLITISVTVWALAVFGFHILLKIVEEPTPEPAYITYQKVWSKQQSATPEEKKELAKVYLTLTGKYISLRQNPAIQAGFSGIIYDLLPEDQKAGFMKAVSTPETVVTVDKAPIAEMLGVQGTLLAEAIPATLGKIEASGQDEMQKQIPGIMDKHLIHYRSFLTDTKIFGFPFHYFYTAVFLKVLFCLICLVYCKVIDGIMKKHGLETANE